MEARINRVIRLNHMIAPKYSSLRQEPQVAIGHMTTLEKEGINLDKIEIGIEVAMIIVVSIRDSKRET